MQDLVPEALVHHFAIKYPYYYFATQFQSIDCQYVESESCQLKRVAYFKPDALVPKALAIITILAMKPSIRNIKELPFHMLVIHLAKNY